MIIPNIFRRSKTALDLTKAPQPRARVCTLILISDETAAPRKVQIPRRFALAVVFCGVSLFAATLALSVRYFQIRQSMRELSELRRDFESIRNEASALYNQLIDVQMNLNQVNNFSNQVREATKLEDAQSPNKEPSNRQQGTGPKAQGPLGFLERLRQVPNPVSANIDLPLKSQVGGIGPLSKADYEAVLRTGAKPQNMNVAGRVNPGSLALGQLFSELESVRDQSSEQIDELTQLLTEVHQYRQKIDQTPTFTPVDGRLTSSFGYRQSPVSQGFAMHKGLDIAAPLGSPIRAAAAGVVTKVGRAPDYGKFVQIAHSKNLITVYAHAQQIYVRAGDNVHKGQKIASVGMTGRTTGPHLHFEVRIGNQRVNPSKYITFNQEFR